MAETRITLLRQILYQAKRNPIHDLIRECTWLDDSIYLKTFCDRSLKHPSMLRATLAKRILTISGLQAMM